MQQAEQLDHRWHWTRRLCFPLAGLLTVAGFAMLRDLPHAGSVVLLHGLALGAAVGLRRPGLTAVMLASTVILASTLGFARTAGLLHELGWQSRDEPWLWLLAAPGFAFALRDLGRVQWRAMLSRLVRRPRVRILAALGLVMLVTVGTWWLASPMLRARTWWQLGYLDLARKTALYLVPPSEVRTALLLEFTDAKAASVLQHLIEESKTWPWFACARPDERTTVVAWAPVAAGRFRTSDLGSTDNPLYNAHFHDLLTDLTNRAVGERAFVVLPGGGGPISAGEQLSAAERFAASRDNHLEASRLGHLAIGLSGGAAACYYCVDITGPAPGVTEHEDGSLTWTREDGTEVRVPPPSWEPQRPPGWKPRPTMPER